MPPLHLRYLACWMILCPLLLPCDAWGQQNESGMTTVAATFKEIQTEGRSRTLIVTDDSGNDLEFRLTPRVKLEITAPGDLSLVQEGAYVSAEAVFTNERLFVSKLQVFLADRQTRLPPGKVAKARPRPGISQQTYQISGPVTARGTDPDYQNYERVAIRASGRIPPIMLEPNCTVTVATNNVELVPEGADVQLEGRMVRDSLNLAKVTIQLSEPLTAATLGDGEGEGGKKSEE